MATRHVSLVNRTQIRKSWRMNFLPWEYKNHTSYIYPKVQTYKRLQHFLVKNRPLKGSASIVTQSSKPPP